MTPEICKKCAAEIHPLEVFPGPKCLDCHAADFVMPTEKQMTNMWGKGLIR